MELLSRKWFLLYIGLVVLATFVWGMSIITDHSEKVPVSSTLSPISALGFYSSSVDYNLQSELGDWLLRQGVINTAKDNVSVRKNSFTETIFRSGKSIFRTTSFYLDIRSPSVSYAVSTQSNVEGVSKSMLRVTCPQGKDQHGNLENCQELRSDD